MFDDLSPPIKLEVQEVGRAADDGEPQHRQVLEVYFNREPTDTELWAFKALALSFDAVPTSEVKSAPRPPDGAAEVLSNV